MGIHGIAWENMEFNGFKWEFETQLAVFVWNLWELRFSLRPGFHRPGHDGSHCAVKLLSMQPERLQADI